MNSVFFQISRFDFLEAGKIYGGRNEFGLRIISFGGGRENYVYLPEVTLNELSMLVAILRLSLIPGIRNLDELRKQVYQTAYYY
jgi:hypothetical protein